MNQIRLYGSHMLSFKHYPLTIKPKSTLEDLTISSVSYVYNRLLFNITAEDMHALSRACQWSMDA